jgi:hypothetical protein
MNGLELFEQIKSASSVENILQSITGKTKAETQSKRGNVFEKIWDLVIKLGFYDGLSNDTYHHFNGNINTCKLKRVPDLERYIHDISVFSKGRGGSSDITLQHKHTGKWVFISCKFRVDDSKSSIDKYDVEKILAVVRQHAHKYIDYDILLCVNNKQKVSKLISASQATSNYITDNIHDILDLQDLEIYFQKLKAAIQPITIDEVNATFCNEKIPLELRFHQDLITLKQMKKIDEGEKELLLGAKARSGKTYCVGGLFIKYMATYHGLNALIITPAPTETLSQFTDDLFRKFRDFNKINIVEIKKGSDLEQMTLLANNIVIVSKQMLDDYVLENSVAKIQQLNLDFIVFDENHFHGTTQMSKNILQSYSSAKTVKLYLTATYAKPLCEWRLPSDCQFYWDIEDEQLCKQRNICGLVDKHGPDVLLFLTEANKEKLLKEYDKMPDLHILTNIMDRNRYAIIKERIKDTSYGFSNGTLLSGNFPNEVDMMLRYITGSNKEEDYPRGDLSIFGRIKTQSIRSHSRTQLNNADMTTMLWFLPFGINMRISTVSEHLRDRMLKNKTLRNYEIKIVNSKKDYKLKDIKEEIKNWELKAKMEGKDGLILLAGNQLTLGITLPFVDIVFLFNDILSSDKIIQMMYRCMTESINNAENDKINSGPKKIGFVVDLNISRVLNTMLDYKVYRKDLNVEQKLTYVVENNLINIDSDLFQGRENKTELVGKLMRIWKGDPINNLKILMKKIEDSIIELDSRDQKMINAHFTTSIGDERVNVKVQFDEENEEALSSGKVVVCNKEGSDDADNESDDAGATTSVNISITKDVLPFVIPLICILTRNTDAQCDILEMLNTITTNPELLNVFNDQSFIWWNKKDIINLVKTIVEKYIRRDSSIYDIAMQFKMSLNSLIDNPKELLELIDSCLKPKQKEKQENGEVFTPMGLIFEKLDKLDAYYTTENGRSIFTEPSFKWFDPATGMGNFPVAVYLRLMDGLQPQIPDEVARKKHILENMLYMSELNKKNIFICRQIFDMGNQYNLNLYEGDTLMLDVASVWGLEPNCFHVILGNPPYNKGGIWSHTKKTDSEKREVLWMKFITWSFLWLRPNGFLAFITPLYWLKFNIELHDEMLGKHIIWLKLWDDSQSKCMINADIPISLFILQNTPNVLNKKTEIISEIKRKKLITTSDAYLNPNYSIPLAFHSIFDKLIQFIEKHNCRLEYKTKTVKSEGIKAKVPSVYVGEDMWAIDTYTLSEGILVKRATETHPDANRRKLIIANKRGFKGAFIDEGNLSLTGCNKYYVLGENLELIQKILTFSVSEFISDYLKYSQSFLDKEAFKFIPDIRKLGILDITEDDFYKLIELSPQEIIHLSHDII